MDSSTKISNIIATDNEKIELLLSSLKDTLITETVWIVICLILFELFLVVMLGIWVIFMFRIKRRQQQQQKQQQQKQQQNDIDIIKIPSASSVFYDGIQCQVLDSQLSP